MANLSSFYTSSPLATANSVAGMTANNANYLGGSAANTYAPKASPTFTGTVTTANLSASGTTTIAGTTTFTGNTNVSETIITRNAIEKANVASTAMTGTVNIDLIGNNVIYFTANASANWTFNFRANSTVAANTYLANNETTTLAILVTQGATAYYPNSHTIDGSAVTPKWQGGTAPTGGNASGIDIYTYTVVKTGAATYTLLAAQTQYK